MADQIHIYHNDFGIEKRKNNSYSWYVAFDFRSSASEDKAMDRFLTERKL